MDKDTVYEDKYYKVINPDSPLNCRDDGGHLILIKKDQVTDRSDLTFEEAIDFMRLSMAVGKAMYDVLGIERMNYEDLGNWGVDSPGGAKMHLHFMGREGYSRDRQAARVGRSRQRASRSVPASGLRQSGLERRPGGTDARQPRPGR